MGFKKCMHLLLYMCYSQELEESFKTLSIKVKVCESQTSFSWHCDFAASELSRSISVFPCRGLAIQRVTSVGGGAITCADNGCA